MEILLSCTLYFSAVSITLAAKELNIGVIVDSHHEDVFVSVNNSLVQMNAASVGVTINGIRMTAVDDDDFKLELQICNLLRQNIVAIMSYASCALISRLTRTSTEKRLPLVDLSPCPCSLEGVVDGMLPEPQYSNPVVGVTLSAVLRERWQNVVVLHDSSYDVPTVREMIDILLSRSIRVALINTRHAHFLRKYKDVFLQNRHFIVMCDFNNTRSLFQQVRYGYLSLLGPYYFWLVVTDHIHQYPHQKLGDVLIDGDNVAIIRYTGFIKSKTERLVSALWNTLNESISADNWDQNATVKCDNDAWVNGDILQKNLLNHTLAVSQQHQCAQYEIMSARLQQHGGMAFDHVGYWKDGKNLQMTYHLFPGKFEGYNNRTFRVATKLYSAFVTRDKNGTYGGICIELLNAVAQKLNFSYVIEESVDDLWGLQTDNGSFNGLIGMLQRKEVDLVVAPIAVNSERQQAADFTMPFWEESNFIILRKPALATSKIFICLGPFKWEVWSCISLSVIVTGLVVWIFAKLTPFYKEDREFPDELCDAQMNTWQVFGALLQQGMVFIPESQSGRFVVAFWWFYVIIVAGTYNGNLIAFLTAPTMHLQVNSPQELADSDMDVGFVANSAIHQYLKGAEHGPFKKIYDKVQRRLNELPRTDGDGLTRVTQRSMYSYLIPKSGYETLHLHDTSWSQPSCQYVRADETFLSQGYAFPMQKNSPYVQTFSMTMLRLLEAGLMERWKHKWYSTGNRCTGLERSTHQTTLALSETQGAFYILGIGIIVSFTALAIERAIHYIGREKRTGEYALKRHSTNPPMTRVGRMDIFRLPTSRTRETVKTVAVNGNNSHAGKGENTAGGNDHVTFSNHSNSTISTSEITVHQNGDIPKHALNGLIKETVSMTFANGGVNEHTFDPENEYPQEIEIVTRGKRPRSASGRVNQKPDAHFLNKRNPTYPIAGKEFSLRMRAIGESVN